MQVILHAGLHQTDEDRALKCLLRNAEDWRHEGVAIPGPSKYRRMLAEVIHKAGDGEPAPETREAVLGAMLQQDPGDVSRLILSNENFFSVPKLIFQGGAVYRKAEQRLAVLRQVFAGDALELFIGLRDPATFLPAVHAATPQPEFLDLMEGTDPMDLRWSDFLRRLRADAPEMPITVWCNEDTPLIWGEVIRRMAGLPLDRKITGAFDVFSTIISAEGMQRFRAFLRENPGVNEAQKRRVMLAFLDKFALQEAIEEELDLPGWDANYVAELSARYDADMAEVAQIEGVHFITP
jgi:hypothetical protein